MSDSNSAQGASGPGREGRDITDLPHEILEQGKQAGKDAVAQARSVAAEAQQHATSLLSTVAEQGKAAAEAQKDSIAGRIDDLAHTVHRSGEQFRGQQDWVAELIDRGAAELSSVATALRSNDLQTLVGNLGTLARRQPAIFIGATMAAGFMLARIGRLVAAGPVEAGRDSVMNASGPAGPGQSTLPQVPEMAR